MPQENSGKCEKSLWRSPLRIKKNLELEKYAGEDRIVSTIEWQAEHDQEPPFLFSLSSKIQALDKLIDGFRDGELITISGYTKNGKTTLAQTLTSAFIKQGQLPLWFTYEVPTKQFLSKWAESPMFFIPRQHLGKSLSWFLFRCEESFLKYGTRVIFIDHLHYLFDMGKSRNASIDIGQIIRTLKEIAVANNLRVFLLCHTSKTGQDKSEPTYHDLRDSSFIAQESDSVMMMHRIPETNQAKLFIEFHRRTGISRSMVPLIMGEDGLFHHNVDWQEPKKEWKNKKHWQEREADYQ